MLKRHGIIMSDIDNAVNQLISSVRESAIYNEYAKQLAEVKKHPGLKEQIDEFRKRNFALQTGADFAPDKLESFEKEYADFRENPLVSDFLAAELAFCRMMQEINIRITEAMQFE